jgi:uncharacterized membrane-anchored protein
MAPPTPNSTAAPAKSIAIFFRVFMSILLRSQDRCLQRGNPALKGCLEAALSNRSASACNAADVATNRAMLSKVGEVTAFFWVIKTLSTPVGQTAADTLNMDWGLGLENTTWVMTALLIVVMAAQVAFDRYIPVVYWLAVVLVSIVGTLITDNLTDNLGIPLQVTTAAVTVALVVVFRVWYGLDRTLSLHSITTVRREAFYWLAILFTFALGTAAGDLVAEQFGLGYLASALLVACIICIVAALHYGVNLNGVLTFWIAYVLTGPLGASLGDLCSHDRDAGGLGLGATNTSMVFLAVIVLVVGYLSWSGVDQIPAERSASESP